MISLYAAQTLDGYLAGPAGELDFLDAMTDSTGNEDYGYAAFLESVNHVVMGRKTLDFLRSRPTWPYPRKHCWVLTHRSGLIPLAEEQFAPFDANFWRKTSRDGAIWVAGGGEVHALFLANSLVDRIVLSIVPVLLGDGVPCFPSGGPGGCWQLTAKRAFPSGLVQLDYKKL